jgi:hypothetical protein
MRTIDGWLQLAELSKMFGLSEESIKRLVKNHGFPLSPNNTLCEARRSRIPACTLDESSTAHWYGG